MKNARDRIMRATAEIISEAGIAGVTFEGVAARAEMTRSGVVYHFRSKQQLIAGAHEYFAEQWHLQTAARLDASFDDASAADRLRAYVEQHTVVAHDSIVEVLTQMTGDQASREIWADLEARWAPLPDFDNSTGLAPFIARLAAQGLWMHQVVRTPSLTPEQLRATTRAIDELLIAPGDNPD